MLENAFWIAALNTVLSDASSYDGPLMLVPGISPPLLGDQPLTNLAHPYQTV
jgi:hypothetical protein